MGAFIVDPKNSSICRVSDQTLAALCVYLGLQLHRADRSTGGQWVYVVVQSHPNEVAEIAQGLDSETTVQAIAFVKAIQELFSAQRKRQWQERNPRY